MADALGMDVGSYKTVLACVREKGVDIVLSETTERSTPTLAAYTEKERLIGASASNQRRKNTKNTL